MVLTHTGYILPSLPRLVLTLGTYHRPSAGAGQPSPAVACSAQTRTTTATTTTTTTRSNPIDEPPRRTMMAPMTQEAAAKAASRIERTPDPGPRTPGPPDEVWDAELGRMRAVRGDGQIVEECVSKHEQRRIMTASANHISVKQYTGKEKFPTQHPWFGYK
eukprot:1184473-Prorocentrum_minimum.AAC.1